MKTLISSSLVALALLSTNSFALSFYANYSNCQDEDPFYVISNVHTDCGYNFKLTNNCPSQLSALTFQNNTGRGIHIRLQPEYGHMIEYNNMATSTPARVNHTKTIYVPYNSVVTVQAADNFFYKRKDVRFGMTCR